MQYSLVEIVQALALAARHDVLEKRDNLVVVQLGGALLGDVLHTAME